jgi:CRP/FNR family transcriptional regulator
MLIWAVDKNIDSFFGQRQLLNFKKGEVILRPSDGIKSIFLLKNGLVRQFSVSKDGEELTVHIFKPGSYFPLMLALAGHGNKYYFEATSDTDVIKSPLDEVLSFVKKDGDVLFDLATRFAKGIVGLAERLEELTTGSIHYRLCSLLVYLAQRMGKQSKNGIEIEMELGHKDIAAWIGTTRETTSRQLEQLAKKKLISFKRGRVTVLDIMGLKLEADESAKRNRFN